MATSIITIVLAYAFPWTEGLVPSYSSSSYSYKQACNQLSSTKSDEELLAERLAAAPSTTDQTAMPWLAATPPRRNNPLTEEPWFARLGEDANLPFECTGCGKCCKTKGDVYLSPMETKGAATLLGLSITEFKQKYVAKEQITVAMSLDPIPEGETGWTLLRHKEEDGSCVFLNDEGLCSIYEARPLQCSTYPFWPRIMASREAWNDEVRLRGNPPDDATSDEKMSYWTIAGGGCEGMNTIEDDGTSTDDIEGVPIAEAADRLSWYQRYKRNFPQKDMQDVVQN